MLAAPGMCSTPCHWLASKTSCHLLSQGTPTSPSLGTLLPNDPDHGRCSTLPGFMGGHLWCSLLWGHCVCLLLRVLTRRHTNHRTSRHHGSLCSRLLHIVQQAPHFLHQHILRPILGVEHNVAKALRHSHHCTIAPHGLLAQFIDGLDCEQWHPRSLGQHQLRIFSFVCLRWLSNVVLLRLAPTRQFRLLSRGGQ